MRQAAIPKLSELSAAGRAELLAIWTATTGKPPRFKSRSFGAKLAACCGFNASRAVCNALTVIHGGVNLKVGTTRVGSASRPRHRASLPSIASTAPFLKIPSPDGRSLSHSILLPPSEGSVVSVNLLVVGSNNSAVAKTVSPSSRPPARPRSS
jgi:hypothetical protein